MRKLLTYLLMYILVISMSTVPITAQQKDYPVQPVPFTVVHFRDYFWLPRIETNRTITIPYAFKQCEETGRIDNFSKAAGLMEGEFQGIYPFDDTDAYKILEGASYTLSVHPDPELEKYLDGLIEKIAAAQEDDGYLYTVRTLNTKRMENWTGKERWSNLARSHELYNMGHLYEAAAALYQATGKKTLLNVALKNAELLDSVFGPNKKRYPPGHQIIEMGLVKLYRVTGNEKYLDLAKFYLDERGYTHEGRELYGEYAQDHKPVIEQNEAVGHAVRATYMYSGMADVAALTGDERYLKAIDRIWENVVSKKFYIIGGVGAQSSGEAFGDNYYLPNMSAYNETCAAIGNVYWNHRLFLLHGDAKYIDVMERTLYNGLISGVSLDGKLFFYPNPLESQGQHSRSPWFGCACCPGNVTRFIASVPGYVYAHRDDIVYVNLFVTGYADVSMKNNNIRIVQSTKYPWEGNVKMTINPQKKGEFAVYVRIPGWARNQPVPSNLYRYMTESTEKPVLMINGTKVEPVMEKGYAKIRRTWEKGDVIELNLPMPVRRVIAHEKVKADRGKVALERGPIVYCAEWPDNKDGNVLNLLLEDRTPLEHEFRSDMLKGVEVIKGKVKAVKYGEDKKTPEQTEQDFLAIPYYSWAHRGKGEMAVWLAREISAVRPLGKPTIASTSTVTASGGRNPQAINDRYEPENSNDHSVQYFHWWPKKGTVEWIQYDFEKPEEVSTVEIYWFDDTGMGECRVPESWRIYYRHEGEWKSVYTENRYGVEKDKFNRVVFETVRTDAIKLEIQLQKNYSAGIHEWKVK